MLTDGFFIIIIELLHIELIFVHDQQPEPLYLIQVSHAQPFVLCKFLHLDILHYRTSGVTNNPMNKDP